MAFVDTSLPAKVKPPQCAILIPQTYLKKIVAMVGAWWCREINKKGNVDTLRKNLSTRCLLGLAACDLPSACDK